MPRFFISIASETRNLNRACSPLKPILVAEDHTALRRLCI